MGYGAMVLLPKFASLSTKKFDERHRGGKVSISSTFYARVFCTIFFGAKISNPKASFVVFGTKILYKKCACKTLMKLTLGVSNLSLYC